MLVFGLLLTTTTPIGLRSFVNILTHFTGIFRNEMEIPSFKRTQKLQILSAKSVLWHFPFFLKT